jgi:hypothetical protein
MSCQVSSCDCETYLTCWMNKPAQRMGTTKSYSTFRIEVRPSPETNDHEVRFFGDDEDIISHFWNDMMGLDPDDILLTPCPLHATAEPHKATVARCSCGVIGCGSIDVEVTRSSESVDWTWGNANSHEVLRFVSTNYDAELKRALTDMSWETPDRTAARLLAARVDRHTLSRHGLSFTWASGRVRKGAFSVSLSLEPGPYQILVHLAWNAESPETISRKFPVLLGERPSSWIGAEWYPQQANLGPPPLAGPSWRRGGS